MVSRAWLVPFTIDEAISYFKYVSTGLWQPDNPNASANNHILNTALSIWAYKVLGNSEFALRLPNVLAGLLYLLYAFKWTKRIENEWLALTLFVGLTGSQFLLEFFGLCRGYGLSMAFSLGAWYHLSTWWCSRKANDLILAVLFVGLASSANLALLLPNAVVLAVIIIGIITDFKQSSFSVTIMRLFVLVGLGLVPLTLLVKAAHLLKKSGLLFYGEGTGFWNVTVKSLLQVGFEPWSGWTYYLIPAAVVLFLANGIYHWLKSRQWLWRSQTAPIMILFLGSIVGQMVMHHILDINYPKDRVALFYLPLSVLMMVITYSGNQSHFIKWILTPLLGIIWLLPLNMISTLNLGHTRLWKEDAGLKEFYVELTEGQREIPIIAGIGSQSYTYYYYNMRNGWQLPSLQMHLMGTRVPDYQYGFPLGGEWKGTYDTLIASGSDESVLLRKTHFSRRELVKSVKLPDQQHSNESVQLFGESLDSLEGADLLFTFRCELQCEVDPFKGWLVLDVFDNQSNQVLYHYFDLGKYRPHWSEKGIVLNDLFVLPGSTVDAHYAKVYLWNIEKALIELRDIELKVFRLSE